MFKDVVTSKQELRAIFGEPSERAVLKCRSSLDEHSRAFIAASPFVLLATSNAAGQCDVSPKGDAPGSVWSWTIGIWSCPIAPATTAPME
jgi:predicted pyridoxine 5'-phosphate oxidase superfamily flavin-nucleotide-binding protein